MRPNVCLADLSGFGCRYARLPTRVFRLLFEWSAKVKTKKSPEDESTNEGGKKVAEYEGWRENRPNDADAKGKQLSY